MLAGAGAGKGSMRRTMMRLRAFDIAVTAGSLCLLAYFGWHGFHGPRSFANEAVIEAEVAAWKPSSPGSRPSVPPGTPGWRCSGRNPSIPTSWTRWRVGRWATSRRTRSCLRLPRQKPNNPKSRLLPCRLLPGTMAAVASLSEDQWPNVPKPASQWLKTSVSPNSPRKRNSPPTARCC